MRRSMAPPSSSSPPPSAARRTASPLRPMTTPPTLTITANDPAQTSMLPPSESHRRDWCGHDSYWPLVAWYLLFGALHECAHLAAAAALCGPSSGIFAGGHGHSHWLVVVFRIVLMRQCAIDMTALDNIDMPDDDERRWLEGVVRHAGWIVSVAVAVVLRVLHASSSWSVVGRSCLIAASITALEAVSTDLFSLSTIPFFPNPTHGPSSSSVAGASTTAASTACHFFCGNFGLILINHVWMSTDSGRHALDLLERMVNVTMMRGAQSGGVVTFVQPKGSLTDTLTARLHVGKQKQDPVVGIRSRVVNRKRTDLSKLVRAKVRRDVFSLAGGPAFVSVPGTVHTFSGHTRFATSSKASFDGTHPQQWTPPTHRRMYNFNLVPDRLGSPKEDTTSSMDFPRPIRVENFITHNGDLDFYRDHNGKSVDLEIIQRWLVIALGVDMPATVDSACIAGFVDLIRTQGCFSLSARYAVCLGMPASKIVDDPRVTNLPAQKEYDKIGAFFEEELDAMLQTDGNTLESMSSDPRKRQALAAQVTSRLRRQDAKTIGPFVTVKKDEEDGESLHLFVLTTINAFFDNDLLNTTKIFLANASGSFGLCVTSSLDAQRQICLAARGQTMSVAFYPKKGIICYGSEQAAVKAGMTADYPGEVLDVLEKSHLDIDNDDLRLDLDDLGGEICLIDWGGRRFKNQAVSPPNRNVATRHRLMNGSVNVYLLQESKTTKPSDLLYHRMTRLTRNQFIKPLPEESADPVLADIRDIPRVCRAIQEDWRNLSRTAMSFNRLTAWNLAQCLRKRMDAHVNGTVHSHPGTIDILLTGCEVSLWLAEEFASDLQKAFPKLRITAVSSNKLLGLYGQEMSIPAVGYPMSQKTNRLDDTIVIIVSHSGGTFAPLACSNLFQSNSRNVFVVTSDWDNQIGKQLRSLHSEDDRMSTALLFNSRVFMTNVGLRPAEPCSVSVAATHQLLTNIFQHICIVILSNQRYSHASGAVITEQDLRILERCNQDNIAALEQIVGVSSYGHALPKKKSRAEKDLRAAGDVWADHVLENAKAYIMSFVYIVATVVAGYPIASAIAYGAGLASPVAIHFVRLVDALIYFYLPQINVLILRLIQRRTLRHRMVGRTVVIADCPWVSQAADAFLSKLFACSYSIAGLNVLSGNPADHFVHRHTHRVVRGSLIVCGRPDGRLSALSSLEASVCLSVNQASSIQSIGCTAESVTIGHNPFKLPLSARAIFLDRCRPKFLCEKMLDQVDAESARRRTRLNLSTRRKQRAIVALEDASDHSLSSTVQQAIAASSGMPRSVSEEFSTIWTEPSPTYSIAHHVTFEDKIASKAIPEERPRLLKHLTGSDLSERERPILSKRGLSSPALRGKGRTTASGDTGKQQALEKRRSSTALLGAYMNLQQEASKERTLDCSGRIPIDSLVESAIQERKWSVNVRELFAFLDKDGDGVLNRDEFVHGYHKLKPDLSRDQLVHIFTEFDIDDNGSLSFSEFVHVMRMPEMDFAYMIEPSIRDANGVIQVEASNEDYFGEKIMKGVSIGQFQSTLYSGATKSQHFSQELYESRIASMQRFVSMAVMFHQMGTRVQSFFARMSFGLLGYRMDRTQSIMRIATTASPVSGADVRERMLVLQMLKKIHHSVHVISVAWIKYKQEKERRRLAELERLNENRIRAPKQPTSTDAIPEIASSSDSSSLEMIDERR